MRIRNNFRYADIGKVLINTESLTTSTILPIDAPYVEVKQEEADWEIIRMRYDLKEE